MMTKQGSEEGEVTKQARHVKSCVGMEHMTHTKVGVFGRMGAKKKIQDPVLYEPRGYVKII